MGEDGHGEIKLINGKFGEKVIDLVRGKIYFPHKAKS